VGAREHTVRGWGRGQRHGVDEIGCGELRRELHERAREGGRLPDMGGAGLGSEAGGERVEHVRKDEHQQKKRLHQTDRHCVRTQEIRLEHPVRPARPQMAPAQWLHPSPLGAIQPASCPPSAPGWSISLPNLLKKPRVSDS